MESLHNIIVATVKSYTPVQRIGPSGHTLCGLPYSRTVLVYAIMPVFRPLASMPGSWGEESGLLGFLLRLRALRQAKCTRFGGICCFRVIICGISWAWTQKHCNFRRVAVLMHLYTKRAKRCGDMRLFDHISSGDWC